MDQRQDLLRASVEIEHREAVQPQHEVRHRGAVPDADVLLPVDRRHDLLREVERVLRALLVREVRVGVQLLRAYVLLPGERMLPGEEDVRRRLEETTFAVPESAWEGKDYKDILAEGRSAAYEALS